MGLSFLFLIWTTLHVGTLPSLLAYSSGAPLSACDNMSPSTAMTSSSAQSSNFPYIITVDQSLINMGESVFVTMQASSNSSATYFKGYLLEARYDLGSPAVGTWIAPANSQTLDCDNNSASALTHTEASQKTMLSTQWVAPASNAPAVVFIYATVVQNINTYWGPTAILQISIAGGSANSGSSGASYYEGNGYYGGESGLGQTYSYASGEMPDSNYGANYTANSSNMATSMFSLKAVLLIPVLFAIFILK